MLGRVKMNHDGTEPSKARIKYRCPLASRKMAVPVPIHALIQSMDKPFIWS